MKFLLSLYIYTASVSANFFTINITDAELNQRIYPDLLPAISQILAASTHKLCYTFITDDNYYVDIFKADLFENITERPVFMSKIGVSEDLRSPDYTTISVLLKSRELRCGVYLILLANGIQMERLLRFAEKHRLFNPNAFFLLLFDRRILTKSVLYIWRRYVNVVFLKERHTKIKRKKVRQYQLITTPYPLTLRDIFVGKQLGVFTHGEFRSSGRTYKTLREMVYPDRSVNLSGKVMRAVVLPHMPGTQRSTKGAGSNYTGLEVHLVESLGIAMNFTAEFYETDDVEQEKWGRPMPNSSFTGVLGEMVRDVADFALADLHYTAYHLNLLDLSYPYHVECLTFLTPEAFADNSWKTLILPFSGEMWAGVLLSLLLVGGIFYGFSRMHLHMRQQQQKVANKMRRTAVLERLQIGKKLSDFEMLKKMRAAEIKVNEDIFDELAACLMYTYSMSLLVSLPRLPRGWSIRLLTGWFWIYCILIAVSYKASMTAILANPTPKLTIDTLMELADSPSIGCGAWGDQNQQLFVKALDPIGQAIGAKMQQVDDTNQAIERVVEGSFAFFENIHVLKEMRMKYEGEIRDESQSQLHIMSECAVHMPLALGLAKNSPLTDRINVLVQRLVESGLVAKWLHDSIERLDTNTEVKPPEALMDIKKLYGAIVFLGIGYCLAVLGLVGELLHWRYVVTRHPMYDKYYKRKYYEHLKQRKLAIKNN